MKQVTKKELALAMHANGSSVEEIALTLKTTASYISNIVVAETGLTDYNDLYTSSAAQNKYARMFDGVLRFKSVESATFSVNRIDELYKKFTEEDDMRGRHQAHLIALIGKNRAEGIGKFEEAKLFSDWLKANLDVNYNQD